MRVTSPTLSSPAWGSCTRNMSPTAFSFEGQQGLISGVPKDRERDISLVKGVHKISQALGLRVKAVI